MELALSQPPGMDDRKRKAALASKTLGGNEPGWADGLRQLYNSVVHEPLPETFDDLLKKLDQAQTNSD